MISASISSLVLSKDSGLGVELPAGVLSLNPITDQRQQGVPCVCRMLTRTDEIVKKRRPECRKRWMVVATRVDDFDNFALSGKGR